MNFAKILSVNKKSKSYIKFSLLIFLTLNLSMHGNCRWDYIKIWPEAGKINLNSIFLIEGVFAPGHHPLQNINKGVKVILKSKRDTVSLEVIQSNIGEYGNLSQVILKPMRQLKPNTKYEIVLVGFDCDIQRKYNEEKDRYDKNEWTTTNIIDSIAPVFIVPPKEISKKYTSYGCGPGVEVFFNYKDQDASKCLIKAIVKDTKTDRITEYYLKPINDTISVGHGMCSGAFELENHEKYEITFIIMDSSGNSNKLIDYKLLFTRPEKS